MKKKPVKVEFTEREAQVVLDELVELTSWTPQEMKEHNGWSTADIRAWSSALAKVDFALGKARRGA